MFALCNAAGLPSCELPTSRLMNVYEGIKYGAIWAMTNLFQLKKSLVHGDIISLCFRAAFTTTLFGFAEAFSSKSTFGKSWRRTFGIRVSLRIHIQ